MSQIFSHSMTVFLFTLIPPLTPTPTSPYIPTPPHTSSCPRPSDQPFFPGQATDAIFSQTPRQHPTSYHAPHRTTPRNKPTPANMSTPTTPQSPPSQKPLSSPTTALPPLSPSSSLLATPIPRTATPLPPATPATPFRPARLEPALPPLPTNSPPRRPRSLALAALADDLIDENAASARIFPLPAADPFEARVRAEDMDAMLRAAAPAPSVAVCAAVYLARVDAMAVPLTALNACGLVVSCLGAAARIVDRENGEVTKARLARVSGLALEDFDKLVDELVEWLPPPGKYVSVADFREYESILDDMLA